MYVSAFRGSLNPVTGGMGAILATRPGAEVLGTRVHFLNTYTRIHRNYGQVLVLMFNVFIFYQYITCTSEYFFNMIL